MKLTSLTLDNIRSHAHTEIPLDKLTVIRGANHSGKSSIEMALEFALTGRCEVTDQGGKGQEDLLRSGEDKGYVAFTLDKGGDTYDLRASLTRASGRTLTMKKPGAKDWIAKEPLDWFAKNRDVLSCVLNNRYFVDLKPKEQKNILAGIILPQTYEFPADIKELAASVGLNIDWNQAPFSVIAQGYKEAYDLRTLVNRQLKEFVVPEVIQAEGLIEDIRSRLRERQAERTKLLLDRERLTEDFRDKSERLSRALAVILSVGGKIDFEERELLSTSALILSTNDLKRAQKTADQAKEAKKLDQQIVELNTKMEEVNRSLVEVEKLGETPCCPTCNQAITEEAIAAIGAPLVERKNQLIRATNAAYDKRKQVGDYEAAQAAVADHKTAEADLKRIQGRLSELRFTLSDAEMARDIAAENPDTSHFDSLIAELEQKIERGQHALETSSRAQESVRQYDAALARQTALGMKQMSLETLVQYFGPDGIKKNLIASHIQGFTESINRNLMQWGYAATLAVEPEYGFYVSRHNDQPAPLKLHQLSKSERYRFSIAFQVALSLHAGVGLAVIDEADMLDVESRRSVYRALYESGLEQVILLSTDERSDTNAAPGAVFIRLEETVSLTAATVLQHNSAVKAMR